MKTDALKVVILLLILALCFLLFLGVRAQAQVTNDQVVLVFDRIENGKIIFTPTFGVKIIFPFSMRSNTSTTWSFVTCAWARTPRKSRKHSAKIRSKMTTFSASVFIGPPRCR